MTLKRLPVEELKERCIEIFYDYMPSTNSQFYDGENFVDCKVEYPTPMDMLWKETQDSIQENAERIRMFEECIQENEDDEDVVKTLKEQIKPLVEEREYFINSSMAYQKELYRKTKTTDYSRTIGAFSNKDATYKYNGSYWTRTISNHFKYCVWNVNSGGVLSEYAVDGISHCIRPCIQISI